MDYALLETELVDVLTAHFAANAMADIYDARPMPENQEELLQDFDNGGQCNVSYMDSLYGDPDSTSIIDQEETVKVGIFMRCNTVKDDKGSYRLLKEVKKALLGYKPNDARTRMWISSYAGWEPVDGQVGSMLEFAFRTQNVQSIVEQPDEAINAEGDVKQTTPPLLEVDEELYVSNSDTKEPDGDVVLSMAPLPTAPEP